ncbi:uroporphyrinogen-III C-methyltransferase [Parashewanella spongiae]|uniref:uroporphyrinogen-III C-methyltransferase n=1 Tax=Parashewanella spongiae TaxID=342950 RepID=A0A3A6TTE7_9GAMM|nr:uroporphyrinogen-III C-methyltransferase [Parashewanella spongiae]MCL1078722.1 uroporphyrinogen-III C-methyltransferase [Parashewanella spongiae]RJY17494.1 uroporphyrinogen-III C-methyltransferase [Parashewanella spongiae]
MELVSLSANSAQGKVYLIGAGPGDPELLTLKAWRLLNQADVVLFDALVSEAILALIPEAAEKISVGKRAGHHSAEQAEINQLLVTKAYHNKIVIRLKGGDPFIFGRGGEELQTLAEAKIEFEVVPGITAAAGAAAYAGIPLTHRDHTQAVSFITGHQKLNAPSKVDWKQYGQSNHTLVIYMGLSQACRIKTQLLIAGRNADTSVALVSNASTPKQQLLLGKLSELEILANQIPKKQPTLIIVGEVTKLSQDLSWFNREPENTHEYSAEKGVNHG